MAKKAAKKTAKKATKTTTKKVAKTTKKVAKKAAKKTSKKGAKKATKKAATKKAPTTIVKPAGKVPTFEEIEFAAYMNFLKRQANGTPGTPQEDWAAAEEALKNL